METRTLKTYLKDALGHLKHEIGLVLNPLISKTQPVLEIEKLAEVLSDPESFYIKNEEMQALFIYLKTSKESDIPMANVPRNQSQDLIMSLESVTLDTISTRSAGVGVSNIGDHISLRSTSPCIARWNLLNTQSAYHPLVVRSSSSQGVIRTFATQIYGGSLDRCKSSFDLWTRIDTSLLQIWCHIFDHWFGVKMVDPLYSLDITDLKGSTKTESKEDVKLPNEEYIKTKSPDIMIQTQKKARSNDSENSKPSVLKGVKKEIKKEEDTDMMIYEVKYSDTCISFPITEHDTEPAIPDLFHIPPYPPEWRRYPSIIARLDAIPSLNPLPALSKDFMSRTFSRQEFSKKFGGSWVRYDGRWKRTPAALQQMPGLGHTFIVGAILKYNFPPHVPCAPGILLNDPGEAMPHGVREPRTVFVRARPGAWLYVGEYHLRLARPLSEWDELSSKMKQDHAPGPLRRALDRGEKKLWVYTMQCIAYHEGIQRAICTLDSCST